MRVIVGITAGYNSRYTNQPGRVIGSDGRLLHVVMDDVTLHDREWEGESCAAFGLYDWRPGEYVIDELPV
jgi:hypothetical protein